MRIKVSELKKGMQLAGGGPKVNKVTKKGDQVTVDVGDNDHPPLVLQAEFVIDVEDN